MRESVSHTHCIHMCMVHEQEFNSVFNLNLQNININVMCIEMYVIA